jgi:hypothetical protein
MFQNSVAMLSFGMFVKLGMSVVCRLLRFAPRAVFVLAHERVGNVNLLMDQKVLSLFEDFATPNSRARVANLGSLAIMLL